MHEFLFGRFRLCPRLAVLVSAWLLALCDPGAVAATPPATATAAKPLVRDAQGLLLGSFDSREKPGNSDDAALGLAPHPTIKTVRGFWLVVPQRYARSASMPLVIVLHRRLPLPRFNGRMSLADPAVCVEYLDEERRRWQALAEQEGFLLALPVGDPDILWMGMAWQCRERRGYFAALIAAIAETHAVDPSRVHLVATGEGAHAAVATAVADGRMFAGVFAHNPPLFEGASRRGKLVVPITVDEMLAASASHARTTRLRIQHGTADRNLSIKPHSVGGIAAERFQDDSAVPAAQVERCAARLRQAGMAVEFTGIPGKHYAPIPESSLPDIWAWLSAMR